MGLEAPVEHADGDDREADGKGGGTERRPPFRWRGGTRRRGRRRTRPRRRPAPRRGSGESSLFGGSSAGASSGVAENLMWTVSRPCRAWPVSHVDQDPGDHGEPWSRGTGFGRGHGRPQIFARIGATSVANAAIWSHFSSTLRALKRTWSWFTPSAVSARICSAMSPGAPAERALADVPARGADVEERRDVADHHRRSARPCSSRCACSLATISAFDGPCGSQPSP